MIVYSCFSQSQAMKLQGVNVCKAVLAVLLALLLRKANNCLNVLLYVNRCKHSVSAQSLLTDGHFQDFVANWKLSHAADEPPVVLFLNAHAIDMTMNWLCNTAHMAGVHSRLLLVTLDDTARHAMYTRWPRLLQYYRPTQCLQDKFSWGDGAYHLFFILRANFAAAMSASGLDVWMMQQDTIWRDNLLAHTNVYNETRHTAVDIVFDRIGVRNSRRAQWINGANFFVRHSRASEKFFADVADAMSRYWVMDCAFFVKYCAEHKANCALFPFSEVSNFEWLYYGGRPDEAPTIMQMDADHNNNKLANFNAHGFYFLKNDTAVCDFDRVERARHSLRTNTVDTSVRPSLTRIQWSAYFMISELLLHIPYLGPALNTYLPLSSYFLQLTM